MWHVLALVLSANLPNNKITEGILGMFRQYFRQKRMALWVQIELLKRGFKSETKIRGYSRFLKLPVLNSGLLLIRVDNCEKI